MFQIIKLQILMTENTYCIIDNSIIVSSISHKYCMLDIMVLLYIGHNTPSNYTKTLFTKG